MKTYLHILGFLCISLNFYAQIKTQSTPNWVVDYDYEISPNINESELSNGVISLLYTEQVNIPEQTYYAKIATKITENVGIQDASTININYDPSYQQLFINHLIVKRGSEVIDKLNLDDFEVLRRESNSESYIYDGSLSAMVHLSDIRTGDIIEYSYSIKGFNPIDNKFSSSFVLDNYIPMGLSAIHVFTKNDLNFKLFNDDLEPLVTEKNGLKNYEWKLENTSAADLEDNVPAWKLLYKNLMVSEYQDWDEVVDWGTKVYDIPFTPNTKYKEVLDKIKSTSQHEPDLILNALNFVQDEIRYLGLESGMSAYKPHSPNEVINQRFGDCKDKSLLLVSLLKDLGVEAYPMLVNTYLKKTILDLPPSTKVFDHCVVKVIDQKGNEMWYDPTIQNQGGLYNTTYFPDYRYGLVLKDGNFEFDEIFPFMDNKTEVIDDFYLEAVGGNAVLEVKTVYRESGADEMRNYFKNNSLSGIKGEFKDYYNRLYKSVKVLEEPRYEDDSLSNAFVVYEKYQIDSLWNPYQLKQNYIAAEFFPYSIYDVLLVPNGTDRKQPFNLMFPMTKQHTVKIHLPSDWTVQTLDEMVSNDHFYYTDKVTYDKKNRILKGEYYFKTQNDYVPISDFNKYYNEVNKVSSNMGYTIYHPSVSLALKGNDNNFPVKKVISSLLWIFGIIMVVVVVGLFAFVILNSKKT